jgi:Spy/CpxP family protein refolding chaperone
VADAPATTDVADVAAATMAAVHPAATAAAMAASAGFGCAEHRKAKRSSRHDDQKIRLTNHDTLLDP